MKFKLTFKGIAIGGTTYNYEIKQVSLENNKITWITTNDETKSTLLKFVHSFKIEENTKMTIEEYRKIFKN